MQQIRKPKRNAKRVDRYKNDATECDKIYKTLSHWLHKGSDTTQSLKYADSLWKYKSSDWTGNIVGCRYLAAIAEARGNLALSIRHRRRGIRLLHRLAYLTRKSSRDTRRGMFEMIDEEYNENFQHLSRLYSLVDRDASIVREDARRRKFLDELRLSIEL